MKDLLPKRNKDILSVAETFYSIQGEGRSMGFPAVFLRLAGCNLLCSGIGWRCDSIEVWKHGKSTEFCDVLRKEHIDHLKSGAHLVITGGEPLLQQEQLIRFIRWMCNWYNIRPFIEVETNGTIAPNMELRAFVDQWNVSPKLSSVGERFGRRVNEAALAIFDTLCEGDVWYKFVISSEEDVLELLDCFPFLKRERIMLMPAGDTRDKLEQTRPIVVEAAKRLDMQYSDRLHIIIWNQKTGV